MVSITSAYPATSCSSRVAKDLISRLASRRSTSRSESLLPSVRVEERVAPCFTDLRSPLLVEHQLGEMLSQRIYGLALGYEDLNDHEQLRHDPLMALLASRRKLEEPLAGKPGS